MESPLEIKEKSTGKRDEKIQFRKIHTGKLMIRNILENSFTVCHQVFKLRFTCKALQVSMIDIDEFNFYKVSIGVENQLMNFLVEENKSGIPKIFRVVTNL